MTSHRVHLSIAFGDVILPVIDCDDGHQRVPLKPISDQVGLDWKTQKRKLLADDYFVERFGLALGIVSSPQNTNPGETCLPRNTDLETVTLPRAVDLGLKRDLYLIRVDRVTAFLNSLNPRMIKGKGNDGSAGWLKAKHSEWDDALHAYETLGVATKPRGGSIDAVSVIRKIDLIKDPALKRVAALRANEDYGLDIPVGKQQGLEV